MSRSYAESNKEKTSDLFNKRVLYKLKARRSASGVRNIVDFTIGEKKLYGKVDEWFSPIYVQHSSKLKPIRSIDSDKPSQAFNFVADLFNEMVREFERCAASGQIDKTDPFLSSLKAYKAFEDPARGYREYQDILFNTIESRFKINNIMVEDFTHFLTEFMRAAETIAKGTPLTLSGYIKSDLNTIMSSGLAIEIADMDYDNDDEKVESFIKSKNWEFFVNACNKYGFIIDHNIPWRIICDVKAPGCRVVMTKYYLTPAELLSGGFSRASINSLISLPKDLLALYDKVKKKRFKKQVICGKRMIQKVIIPPTYTSSDIIDKYGLDHFLKIYMKLRLLEEKPEMDADQKRFLIKDVLQYVRLKGDYGALESYFEKFINKPFDKRYSMTYNYNVVMPARQKMLQGESLAYSVNSIKQAMTSY